MDGWSLSINNSSHKGGRVWILWNPSIFHVDFLNYSAQCINMKVTELASTIFFYLSMVYAFNDIQAREELWAQLVDFSVHIKDPWLVCGDFNCVLSHAERLVGNSSDKEIDDFQGCLTSCGLVDSPTRGSFFTWNNKQDVSSRVYSRLDRALINQEWSDQMPTMYAHFLPEGIFDHTPCLLKSSGQQNSFKKRFKYFNMWGKSPYFLQSLQGWWKNSGYGTKMYCLVKKMQQLKPYFRQYNRDYFSDIENSAMLALKNLEYIQAQLAIDPRDSLWLQKEQDAIGEYKELQTACTLFLSQKAKAAWIKDGDSNTKYFHGVIKSNFMKNQVLSISDMAGKEHEDPQMIQNAFLQYYIQLLGTEKATTS
ncbi:uncharacterized protein LOC141630636 [Silene latifolia]|uniref:uncharacterized protein LOC141630636 n=1 Tax=Silene latifolia TaxID=37657 RepID=UPI003D771395